MTVRTRFAPSPTGFLHIGGVRTALFSWLVARNGGGQFVLRIDDTDQQRHVDAAVGLILEGFRWMGMDWDEGPMVQSADLEPYGDAMKVLAAKGVVYPSDLTRQQIEAAASAPQEGSGEVRFPPELRPTHRTKPRFPSPALRAAASCGCS